MYALCVNRNVLNHEQEIGRLKKISAVLLSIVILVSSLDLGVYAEEIEVLPDGAEAVVLASENETVNPEDLGAEVSVIPVAADEVQAEATFAEGAVIEEIVSETASDAVTADATLSNEAVSYEENVVSSDGFSDLSVSSTDDLTEETVYSEDNSWLYDDAWDFSEEYELEEDITEEIDEYSDEDDYVDNGSWRFIYVLPSLTGNKREDAVNLAYSQIGYHEGGNNKNAYGANAAWCVYFARWCARCAGLTANEWGNTGNTIVLSKWFRDRDRFHDKVSYEWSRNGIDGGGEVDDYIPKPGDFVAIESHNNEENGPDHTAIVYSVKGDQMITVEGNLNNQVGLVVYSLRAGRSIKRYVNGRWHFSDTEHIVGFGEPDYGDDYTYDAPTLQRAAATDNKKKSSDSKHKEDVVEEEIVEEEVFEEQPVVKRTAPVTLRNAVITGIPEEGIPSVNGEVSIEQMIRDGEIRFTATDGTVLKPYDPITGDGDFEIYYKIKSRGRKISVVFIGTGSCIGTLRKTYKIAK